MKHQIRSISQNHKRNHQIPTLTKILFIVLILSAYSQSAFADFNFPSQPRDYVGNDRYHQPAIDFDTDSCFPSSAVDSNGKLNPGISDKSITGGCRPSYNGHANIYARSKCQKEGGKNYCAHVWGLYFEKIILAYRDMLDICMTGST